MSAKKSAGKRAESGQQETLEKAIVDLIGMLGKVINSATLYGESHRMTRAAYDEAYAKLKTLLENRRRIRISLFEGTLHVDSSPLAKKGALLQVVSRQMKKLEVSGFAFLRGMTREEFGSLMQMLASRQAPDDDFSSELQRLGVQHVESEKEGGITRLGENETIVSRQEAKRPGGEKSATEKGKRDRTDDRVDADSQAFMRDLAARMNGAEQQKPGTGDARQSPDGGSREDAKKAPEVKKILAFLKGSDTLSSIPSTEELQSIASDSEKLANLIMESATVQQRNDSLATGESLADLVVGALRRTYNGLRRPMSDPNRQIDARKSLLMLEKSVLERLHKMMEGVDAVEAQVDADFVDEVDEVEVATMTAEYVRRRESLERMENEVMRYIKGNPAHAHEGERLHSAFQDAGLSSSEWRELVAKGGGGSGGEGDGKGGGGGGGADLGALTMLLSQLDRLMEGDPPDAKSVGQTVQEVSKDISRLSENTKGKMDKLGTTLDEAEAAVTKARDVGKSPPEKLAGRELLAEIVQELCQPATAISCSAMMLQEGMFGPMSSDQSDVMQTVADCGDKLNRLLEHLKNIVGYPSDFVPKHDQV